MTKKKAAPKKSKVVKPVPAVVIEVHDPSKIGKIWADFVAWLMKNGVK